ncbi:hemicentin-1-like [Lacerta agilis]|uniref:hemicentin-1-like n=1 Tax=Lacerta agilis TaxID=80427 RepID=UPI001419D444|nr:hemicentin-1-like [Lacerta agilis]
MYNVLLEWEVKDEMVKETMIKWAKDLGKTIELEKWEGLWKESWKFTAAQGIRENLIKMFYRWYMTPTLPRLTLGPTEVVLGKPSNLTCAASDYYPARLSVKWLRGSETLKVDSPAGKPGSNYLFYAESVLEFTPQISDAGVTFSCLIQHQAAKDPISQDFELVVVAPPRLTLGLTDVEMGEPSNLMCAASDFYPGNVSVKWLRGSETLKVDSPPVQPGPNGLFYAESVLEFTPQISDAGVTFSCLIQHQAVKHPISQDFELKVHARPELHMVTRPPGKTFLVAECLVCGFYPQNIKVQWLQNGKRIQERIYESELVHNPNGTFSTGSVFFPKQGLFAVNYTCQVQHEALEAPLKEMIPWEPEAPGYFGSPMTWLLGSVGHLVGLGIGVGVTLIYLRRRAAKYDQAAPNDQTLLKKMSKGAWAAVIIQVPSTPVQAGPRSNAYMPCYFTLDPPRTINASILKLSSLPPALPRLTLGPTEVVLGKPSNLTCAASDYYPARLSVKWLRGSETLKVDSPAGKPGSNYLFYAESVLEFTPQISDAGVTFSCLIQHQAAKDPISQDFELVVVAPPRLTLGLTDVEMGEPSNLMCAASDFYPGNVSVKWLRGSETLKVDSPPVQPGPNGLFYAESVLEFTPQISDAGVTFSCLIQHKAVKDPISQDFELKVQARPELHMVTRPPGKTFLVAECLVCGFYPQNVTVQWLQNGKPIQERIYESEFVKNPNETFSTGSVFFPKQGLFAANYTCRVQHEALEAPLEETIPWEPEGAAVIIQVPSSPVQAGPHSDVYLPCHFSLDPPRPINVDFLIVTWWLRGRTVAKFDTNTTASRPRGAVLDAMRLQEGNATLYLQDVRDEDAGEYICFVLHTPDTAERKVALKIEAPPRLTLGPTEVLLGKPSNLTCAASNFYPGNVSVKWLRGSETLKVDLPPVQPGPNGLFYAESVLEFTPQISDAGVTFSCHIQHQAVKDPISQDFELKVHGPVVRSVWRLP